MKVKFSLKNNNEWNVDHTKKQIKPKQYPDNENTSQIYNKTQQCVIYKFR